MEYSLANPDALARLEEPFAAKDVKWLVAATSRDGRKGRVTPYADPRAYTDRLNQVFTASGWTRQYSVHTVSPVTRTKKDKPIQTGKVLVTCVVSIPGVGTHSGSGEVTLPKTLLRCWFTLRRNKNSQDSVEITQPECIPAALRRFEAKIDGALWLDLIDALPRILAKPLAASIKSSEPSNGAIKRHIANGGVVEGASVKRGYHLRIE